MPDGMAMAELYAVIPLCHYVDGWRRKGQRWNAVCESSHLQEPLEYLRAGNFALCMKRTLSERSEFVLFSHGFSKISGS